MNGKPLQNPLKISDLMKGTTFELSSEPMFSSLSDEEEEDMFWDKEQDPNTFKSPCVTSLMELKASMAEISDGIFKRIEKKPEQGAKKVDLDRQRITYHRNMYSEGEDYPFDSTYLNGETDEVCLPLKKDSYLEGFLEALSSMKEGEQSLFVISYKKMFKELGCPPRILPKADILCDLKVVQLQEVGNQDIIDNMSAKKGVKFSDIRQSLEEVRLRASDLFSSGKVEAAMKLYQRILQAASFAATINEEEDKYRNDVLSRAHTNLAVCSNKKEDFNQTLYHVKCLENCGSIVNQTKVFYAKGVALMKLGKYDEAVVTLTKALKLKPMDKQVIQAVEELNKRKKNYDEERISFGKNLKFH